MNLATVINAFLERPAGRPEPQPARGRRRGRGARLLHDPSTYVDGVPYAVLADLRREHGVVRVEEPEQLGWPEGPGYWLVLRHADVMRVLRDPETFSSWLGGTQIRDPATDGDLAYVRRMMLNMDPPEHSRLRRMLARSFTPRAIGASRPRSQAMRGAIVDRMLAGPRECRLRQGRRRRPAAAGARRHARRAGRGPLAALRLVQPRDRLAGPRLRRRAQPSPGGRLGPRRRRRSPCGPHPAPTAGCPTRAAAPACRTSTCMPPGWVSASVPFPGDDVMSILMAQRDDAAGGDGHVTIEEFENLFWLFAVAGNETLRNGIPGAMIALLEHPRRAARAAARTRRASAAAVDELLRWWTPVMTFRRTATTRHGGGRPAGRGRRQGGRVVRLGQP